MGVSPILSAALRHDLRTATTPFQRAELIRDLLVAADAIMSSSSAVGEPDETERRLLDDLIGRADAHVAAAAEVAGLRHRPRQR